LLSRPVDQPCGPGVVRMDGLPQLIRGRACVLVGLAGRRRTG
jgi:hypothetical protein